jgi:hypothetical protein
MRIKLWSLWDIGHFSISQNKMYILSKFSNVPSECVYVCTYLFVDFLESQKYCFDILKIQAPMHSGAAEVVRYVVCWFLKANTVFLMMKLIV